MYSHPRFAPVLWTVCGSDMLLSTFCPCFVDGVWFRYAPVHVLPLFCGRCVWFRYAPVHVLPLFCGLCVVPICSRPRKCPFLWTVCGSDVLPSTFRRFRWTIQLRHVLPSTFCPCFVDGVWFRYAPVHENAPFCGRDGVLMCSRPRFAPVLWTVCGSDVLPSTFCPCFVDGVWFRCASVHVLPLFCGRCVWFRYAPVHVLPLFCGRDGVLICSRPRKCPFLWMGCRRRPCYSFFSASAGLVRIRRRAWRITVAMVTSRTIMRAVR